MLTHFQGTAMFMAHTIWADQPFGRDNILADFRTIPELSQQACAAYGKNYLEHLIHFNPSPCHTLRIKGPVDPSTLTHELCHDAKSAFWLLLYWILNAAAADGPITVIPQALVVVLAGVEVNMRPLEIPAHVLDPSYAPLSELLLNLAKLFNLTSIGQLRHLILIWISCMKFSNATYWTLSLIIIMQSSWSLTRLMPLKRPIQFLHFFHPGLHK